MVILNADDRRREGRSVRKTGCVSEVMADDRTHGGDSLDIFDILINAQWTGSFGGMTSYLI